MKRGYIYVIGFIIIFILAVFSGYYLFKQENKPQNNIQSNEIKLNEITNEQTNSIANEITIQTTQNEEKVTPNTDLVLKKYYKECNHTINEYVEMPAEMINLTKEEIQKEYEDWEIKEFSVQKVILQKEETGNCNQHYVIKEKDGIIAIYKINKDGEEILKEETAISTQYLSQTDLLKIQ